MPTASFKLTAGQMLRLRRKAHAKHMNVSEYLRAAALPGEAKPGKRKYKKNPISGLMVDATPGPAITDEMVRDALADLS
jgi:hypothetical protein